MLNLASETDSSWITGALAHLDEVLIDHAHCEKKAAGMAVQLLFRYPHHGFLHTPLSRLAREELVHFEEVLRHLEQRGLGLRPLRPSAYAGRLRAAIRGDEPALLIDTLLCCALIEARSCERFAMLAEAVPEPELAHFYRGLLASEARHHQIYLDLAESLAPRSEIRSRLEVLAAHEAAVLTEVPVGARMHSGNLAAADGEARTAVR